MTQSTQDNTTVARPRCDAIQRVGYVVGYTADGLLVDVSIKEACQQCAQGRGCGMGVLARKSRQRVEVSTSYNSSQCRERYPLGSSVALALERSEITLLALLVYAFPLLLALLLSGGVTMLSVAPWLAPVSFFAVLLFGLIGLRLLLSGRTERFRPRLVS